MSGLGLLAVGIGATMGAWLRWLLGTSLDKFFVSIPPGTLAANLIGGYVVGVAIAYFSHAPGIAPEWRLLIVTGFCGGLTTFSTFSAEITALLQQGRFALLAGAIAVHVGGSLIMTLMGITSMHWLRN